ncbi:hypothetical protein [Bartonella schoenbuchensis]|uniref:hypothetical protein n=1 Tax=Bartonella schoenbuchensis TaxID=165694 RepID=UPI00054E5064|nr:hypothetical protein [Bartonella schoenbuchensis]
MADGSNTTKREVVDRKRSYFKCTSIAKPFVNISRKREILQKQPHSVVTGIVDKQIYPKFSNVPLQTKDIYQHSIIKLLK